MIHQAQYLTSPALRLRNTSGSNQTYSFFAGPCFRGIMTPSGGLEMEYYDNKELLKIRHKAVSASRLKRWPLNPSPRART
jgi:hypothetical protein